MHRSLFVWLFFTVQPPIAFKDIGIPFVLDNARSGSKHQIETMIGGVAAFDYDNDGLLDVYFVNGAAVPGFDKKDQRYWNRLFHNDGKGVFTDVTSRAGVAGQGYGMGVAAADYDNDGLSDLYVTGVRQNQLFHNNGDGTFSDETASAGDLSRMEDTFSVSAGWFDYNRDGRLDLFVVRYIQWSLATEPPCTVNGLRAYCSPQMFQGLSNLLYRNNGDGTFTDVSAASGIGKHVGKGMGVAFADYDEDGFPDVFVANDTFRNFLFHNNGDGTFTESATLAGVAYNENGKAIAGMGADFRDLDNDGRPDIFLTGMFGDTFPLYRNDGKQFVDVTAVSGIARATARLTGWSAGAYDFDNDGYKDLFTANSAILDNSEQIDHLPFRLRNLILRNQGRGRYGAVEVGEPAAHRGAAFGDLDNDGGIDAVTSNLNEKSELFMNRSQEANHWILLRLEGSRSNRDGLGARVTITTPDGTSQYNHATTSVGYASSSDKRVHFGLGKWSKLDKLRVTWPSGTTQVLTNIRADQVLVVKEPER